MIFLLLILCFLANGNAGKYQTEHQCLILMDSQYCNQYILKYQFFFLFVFLKHVYFLVRGTVHSLYLQAQLYIYSQNLKQIQDSYCGSSYTLIQFFAKTYCYGRFQNLVANPIFVFDYKMSWAFGLNNH